MNILKSVAPEMTMIGGWAAVSYGAWLLHPAAGFLVGGALAIVAGVKMASV